MADIKWIEKSWEGDEKLWKVFWLYNWLLTIAIGVIGQFAVNSFGYAGVIAAYTMFTLWYAWFVISTWRCAFNVSWQGWGYIARAFVIFWIATTFISLINSDGT